MYERDTDQLTQIYARLSAVKPSDAERRRTPGGGFDTPYQDARKRAEREATDILAPIFGPVIDKPTQSGSKHFDKDRAQLFTHLASINNREARAQAVARQNRERMVTPVTIELVKARIAGAKSDKDLAEDYGAASPEMKATYQQLVGHIPDHIDGKINYAKGQIRRDGEAALDTPELAEIRREKASFFSDVTKLLRAVETVASKVVVGGSG